MMELDPRSTCIGNGWYRPVHHWASWGLPCALMNSHEGQKGWAPFCCWMQLVDRTKGDEKGKKANTRQHTVASAASLALPALELLPHSLVPPAFPPWPFPPLPRPHDSCGRTVPSAL